MTAITTRFRLGSTITPEQRAFLDTHGFLHFEQVLSEEEVTAILNDIDTVESRWISEGRTNVFGIPLFVGQGVSGLPFINRFCFSSQFSPAIHAVVHDERLEPIRQLISAEARVGDREKDGVVFNRYLNIPGSAYPELGWHTDGLRDLFYGRKPLPMLNVGFHFDHSTKENGGLRLIPGTHRQGFRDMCFRKLYFLDKRADPQEIAVETRPGDLTIHDGRLWHRVARSPHTGAASLRRTMFVPFLTGPYEPKSDTSPTPLYHQLGALGRKVKVRLRKPAIA